MLVVVSIILILATVAVPKFTSAGKTAKIAKIEADLHTISNAAALYEVKTSVYPNSVDDLVRKGCSGKAYFQSKPTLPDGMECAVAVGLIVIYGAVKIGFVLCCCIFTLSIHSHICVVNVIQTWYNNHKR